MTEKLYSFDVFDTLITRTTATPKGIFILIQQRLLTDQEYADIDQYVKDNYAILRERAEILAHSDRSIPGIEDVTLYQIYETMMLCGNMTTADIEKLILLEKEIELENVVGIWENITKVKCLLEKGEKVILISDMYLDSETIRKMLTKIDDVFSDIPIYVSSEVKLVKGTAMSGGHLYQYIKDHENILYSNWIHTGDNLNSDVKAAQRLGINIDHFKFEQLRSYEKELLKKNKYDVQMQLAIGTARNIRMNEKYDIPAVAGCSFSGIVLFEYVYWILMDCTKRNIHHLFFVARDGYIAMKIAGIIIDYLAMPIKTHYLYGSRKTWRMAAYEGEDGELTDMIYHSVWDEILSFRQLAAVLQIEENELYDYFPEFKQVIDFSMLTLTAALKMMDENVQFRQFLIKKHQKRREASSRYLQESIDGLDSDDFAFVEANGTGYSILSMAKLLNTSPHIPLETYYFQMINTIHDERCVFHNFLFESENIFIEIMTRNCMEQTVDFKVGQNGKMIPILNGNEGMQLKRYGYESYEKGVLCFVKRYIRIFTANRLSPSLSLVNDYMQEILNGPLSDEFFYFADAPFSASGAEDEGCSFAPQLTKEQLENIYIKHVGANYRRYYMGASWEMSLRRSIAMDSLSEMWNNTITNVDNVGFPGGEEIPFELLGESIVIYGAGNYGKKVYEQAVQKKRNVIQWLDHNYIQLKEQGLPVTGNIDNLGEVEYDTIIIAILNCYNVSALIRRLKEEGVPLSKIFCPLLLFNKDIIDYEAV